MVIVVESIAISFYKPNFAMSASWLLLVFHFLPGGITDLWKWTTSPQGSVN
jgi:hypothetical protein